MNASVEASRRSMFSEAVVRKVLFVDGVVNVGAALVLWVTASTWAAALALGTSMPVVVLGAVLFANGVECVVTSRRPFGSPGPLWVLAAVDFAFAAAALAVAATDPTGAAAWARWVLAAAGDAAVIVGAVKGYAGYRLTREAARG